MTVKKLISLLAFLPVALTVFPQNSNPGDSVILIEKVYLQTDRDIYSPGDDLWFKAYLVDGSDRLLSDHSNNLHVELISPDLKIILSHVIKMDSGLGNGDFALPRDLNTGRYILRAYTNYMRNFGDELFFKKELVVVTQEAENQKQADTSYHITKNAEISLFPEGGSLVDNVPSVIAFKAVDRSGKSCDVSGEVLSSAGKIITQLISTHKGMGTFTLTPQPGISYYAIARDIKGGEMRSDVPESFPTGVIINIMENTENELQIAVRTNEPTLARTPEIDLTVLIAAHNLVYKAISFRTTSLNSILKVPTDGLPEGIAILTLTDSDDLPLCERLVYIKSAKKSLLDLVTDKRGYNKRDSVSVILSFQEDNFNPQTAFISLSATEALYTDELSSFPSNISSWFLLESDVTGPVEDPSYYFDRSNHNRLNDLDLLLLTQGWRDFRWKYERMKYPPENGFNVSGRLRKKFIDAPLNNAKVNIGIFSDTRLAVESADIDSTGRFCLNGLDLTGEARLIVSGSGQKDKMQGWLLLDSIKYEPAYIQGSDKPNILNDTREAARSVNPLYEVQFKYDKPGQKNKIENIRRDAGEKTAAAKKYKLTDTIALPEVTVMARRPDEYKEARERNNLYQRGMHIGSGAFGARELNTPNAPGAALVVVDGVVRREGLAGFPMDNIEAMDFLNGGDAAVWGQAGRGGVLSIVTKKDWESKRNNGLHSVNVNFSGYYQSRIFYSPKHRSSPESDFKPDIRTTLFWEPDIRIPGNENSTMIFFNSDNSGVIRIIAEGITSDGIPVTCIKYYEVR